MLCARELRVVVVVSARSHNVRVYSQRGRLRVVDMARLMLLRMHMRTQRTAAAHGSTLFMVFRLRVHFMCTFHYAHYTVVLLYNRIPARANYTNEDITYIVYEFAAAGAHGASLISGRELCRCTCVCVCSQLLQLCVRAVDGRRSRTEYLYCSASSSRSAAIFNLHHPAPHNPPADKRRAVRITWHANDDGIIASLSVAPQPQPVAARVHTKAFRQPH